MRTSVKCRHFLISCSLVFSTSHRKCHCLHFKNYYISSYLCYFVVKMPSRCCVCLAGLNKRRSYPATKHKAGIFGCFGDDVCEGDIDHCDRLCNTCYGMILSYNDNGTKRPDRVKSKGQRGYHSHLQVGGKRVKIARPESVSMILFIIAYIKYHHHHHHKIYN